jgi:hypothetical protein
MKVMPLALPDEKTKDLLKIEWRNQGKTGGGGIMKNKMPSQKCKNKANREGGIMKKEMPSLLLDEKICIIRLP